MHWIKILHNKEEKQIPNFFQVEGDFDFYVTLEINGSLGTTNSNIQIMVYHNEKWKILIACNFKWLKVFEN